MPAATSSTTWASAAGWPANTLARANQERDWRIDSDFARALIRLARPLYLDDDLGLELDNTVYALDSSTVDLCLSAFSLGPLPIHQGSR